VWSSQGSPHLLQSVDHLTRGIDQHVALAGEQQAVLARLAQVHLAGDERLAIGEGEQQRRPNLSLPGGGPRLGADLRSQGSNPSIIGAAAFHDPVRDGTGWDHRAQHTPVA